MGSNLSRAQLGEYREIVKDRLSEEAIEFLHMKFMKAAPDGLMTPLQFKRYIDATGVYKDKRLRQREQRVRSRSSWFSKGGAEDNEDDDDVNAAPKAQSYPTDADDASDLYLHLFRGYDIDGDGVITFKEFLIYHLAVIYSTEELFYVVFSAYDEDGDGYLSLGDIKSVITAATRYVGDYDVRDKEVIRVIDEEARRLMGFLDIRQQGRIQKEDMRLITQKYPQVLEKMKNLM